MARQNSRFRPLVSLPLRAGRPEPPLHLTKYCPNVKVSLKCHFYMKPPDLPYLVPIPPSGLCFPHSLAQALQGNPTRCLSGGPQRCHQHCWLRAVASAQHVLPNWLPPFRSLLKCHLIRRSCLDPLSSLSNTKSSLCPRPVFCLCTTASSVPRIMPSTITSAQRTYVE